MKSWIFLAIVIAVQIVLGRGLFHWADRQPSDFFAAGLLFWLVLIVFALVDVVWLGVNVIEFISGHLDWH